MALQLRRGINSQRAGTPLAAGELVYVTDNLSAQVSPLYIGDGSTTGGVPIVRVVSVNGQSGAVILNSDVITEGTTNKYYTAERAQDDVAAALVASNSYNTGITFVYGSTEDNAVPPRIRAVVAASGTVNSGTTGKIPYYSAGGTAISPTVNLSWQESVKTLTIGGGTINMDADVSDRSHITLETSATGVPGNSISFNRARGLTVSKTTIVSGDVLGNVNFSGYDGDQFVTSAIIRGTSNGAVSNNNVPSLLGFFTTDTDGVIRQHVRMLGSGQTIFGPANTTDTGSGSIRIISTSNTGEANNVSALGIQTFFNGQDGQNFSAIRARGTRASSLPVVSGDDILDFNFNGYDGSGYPLTAQITVSVDNAVSVGIVPSALTFSVTNISGARNPVVKINNGTGTSNGLLAVTGTVKASVAIQTAVFADNTARNTTIPVPLVGMIIFNTATGKFEGNTDGTQSGWVALN